MTPGGIFVPVGARPGGHWIGPLPYLLRLLVSSWFMGQKRVLFMAKISTADLTVLKELIEAKKVTPVVDRRFEFREAAEALRYLKEGHARGKVVIAMEGGPA